MPPGPPCSTTSGAASGREVAGDAVPRLLPTEVDGAGGGRVEKRLGRRLIHLGGRRLGTVGGHCKLICRVVLSAAAGRRYAARASGLRVIRSGRGLVGQLTGGMFGRPPGISMTIPALNPQSLAVKVSRSTPPALTVTISAVWSHATIRLGCPSTSRMFVLFGSWSTSEDVTPPNVSNGRQGRTAENSTPRAMV